MLINVPYLLVYAYGWTYMIYMFHMLALKLKLNFLRYNLEFCLQVFCELSVTFALNAILLISPIPIIVEADFRVPSFNCSSK